MPLHASWCGKVLGAFSHTLVVSGSLDFIVISSLLLEAEDWSIAVIAVDQEGEVGLLLTTRGLLEMNSIQCLLYSGAMFIF